MTAVTTSLGAVGVTYSGLSGKTKEDFGRGDGRYVTFMEVMKGARLFGDSLGHVDVQKSERQNEVQRGDVLFNGSSETPEEVALGATVDFDVPRGVYLNSFCFGYRISRPGVIDPTYLAYYMRSSGGRQLVSALAQGATRYNIAKTKLMQVPLSFPSLAEQRRIAEALVDVDDLIALLERFIAKKRAIKQGMMQELLTGRTRLPGFSGSVPTVRLGAVASMGSGGTPDSKIPRYYGGGVPWVSISDMTSAGKYIRQTQETLSEDGLSASAAKLYAPDVVLYAMYASLGECSIAVGRVSSSQAILGIQTNAQLDREFLYYYLQFIKTKVRTRGQQGTQSNLNAGMVRDFEIPLPSKREQSAIVVALSDADAEIAALDRRLEAICAIKQGMMQELLTGRTRLPVEEVAP